MDLVDMASEFAGEEVDNNLRKIREIEKRRPKHKVIFTECLNCFEASSNRFCSSECRDDFDKRKARQ